MKTTEHDVKYCGVREDVIRSAKPKLCEEVVRFHNHWIFERYRIKLRKDSGQPQPWTEDEVLRDFRFTNVRREDDRESKYLITNISEHPTMSMENKFYNTLLFRSFNKWETIEKIGGPFDWDSIDVSEVFDKIENYSKQFPKYVWFTNAFNTGGLKRASGSETVLTCLTDDEIGVVNYDTLPMFVMLKPDKYYSDLFTCPKVDAEKYAAVNQNFRIIQRTDQNIPLRIVKMIKRLKERNLFEKIMECPHQQRCYEMLNEVRGFGPFLAYQIFVDLTYIPGFKFSENEFTVSGPGCSLGISYMFEDLDGMTDDEAIFWVRDNIQRVWGELGLETDVYSLFSDKPECDRCLNVMSLENVFCELSKYTRAVRGTGRPRNKYKPFDGSGSDLNEFF